MTKKVLTEKCKEYQELDEQIKVMELQQKEIQVMLKKELEKLQVEEMDVDIYHFSYKPVKPKKLFDTKAFAEKHPKLFAQFTTESKPSSRFLFGLIKK